MVLLAASICSKEGKALVSRQFVEMTKTRIEGLIATFPKLIGSGKQHTFVETESVRYVYQPLEKLYVLLITTKASNILEDLETLRLFARVIPEYACGTEEVDIIHNAFQLIFAFDEIIALGYRENVNVGQIRTYTEMDSQEERIYQAVRENQEREAKESMKRKVKELQQAKMENSKRGGGYGVYGSGSYGGSGGFSGGSGGFNAEPYSDGSTRSSVSPHAAATTAASGKTNAPKRTGGGMQLGGGGAGGGGVGGIGGSGVDSFLDQLKAEGEKVASAHEVSSGAKDSAISGLISKTGGAGGGAAVDETLVHREALHLRVEERLTVVAGRDGGLDSLEVLGILQVCAATQAVAGSARIHVETAAALAGSERRPPVQLQTHPNIDKKVFQTSGMLQTKVGGKAYPLGQEVGVLKWRMQTQDDAFLPFTINCWPNEIAGGFEVNIELELQDQSLELHNVCVTIPLPAGCKAAPNVGTCDGDYQVDAKRTSLEWRLALLDGSSPSAGLEFTVKTERGARADAFYPVAVHFTSDKPFADIRILSATDAENVPIKFSTQSSFYPEKYEIA